MKGFEMAKGDYIGFTDADNSTNPENFFKLYNHLNNSEKELNGVIASRKIKGARVYPRRKFRLGFSSFLFGRVVNLLFNLKIKDHQCGAKLFDKKTTKFLLGYFTEVGWHFDVDLLYLCKKNNFKILECPIFWIDSEGSHLNFFEGILSVSELFKYRLRKL